MSKKKFDIGILGGGQLGRMLLDEGRPWGLRFRVLDPSAEAPCAALADDFMCASLQDPAALASMAETCRILTIEIEQVAATALANLQTEGHRMIPTAAHIARLQDKGAQKQFFKQTGLPTSPFVCLKEPAQLTAHGSLFPAVAKLCRSGYDGRGVVLLSDDPARGASELNFRAPFYIEQRVNICKELALVVARNDKGELRVFEPVEMVFHEAHMLDYLIAPADITPALQKEAMELAVAVVEALDYVGVLAIELFWDTNNRLLINELAPRVHNSGHHSREAHESSQFGQLLRILQGWPLASVDRRVPHAAVVNIIGPSEGCGVPHYEGMGRLLADTSIYPYLYGKHESRPGRKLGHVTILAPSRADCLRRIHFVKKSLRVRLLPTASL